MVGGQNALRGVVDAARERDVNLLCFHQRVYQGGEGYPMEMGPASWDTLAEVVDGLVVYQSWPNEETFTAFRSRFPSLPMANALRVYEGCAGLAPDSYQGMKELTCHLIKAHGYRRIAFVTGPEGNWAVGQRYRGYVDALAEHGIPLNPNLITPHLDWAEAEREAVSLLLDERKLLPGADFEAVVTSNDSIALSMLIDFQSRGVRVPDEVAVAGFDDDSRAACSMPPLTTMRLPSYEIGRQAVDLVLAQIAGEQVPERTLVPPRMMVRRSCGCQALAVEQAATEPAFPASKRVDLGGVFRTQHAQILSDMIQTIGQDDAEDAVTGWAEQVLSSFAAEMEGGTPGMFLAMLEDVLSQVMGAGGAPATDPGRRVAAWQGAVSALRRRVLPYLGGDVGARAEGLWQQARVMIAVMVEQAQARQALQAEQQAAALRGVSRMLITTFDVGGLMDVLAEGLPRLGIPGAYLALHEDPEKPAEWSRLMLAYDEEGCVGLGTDGVRFPSPQLVPEGMWPQERRYSFIVSPLSFQGRQLGFVLYEMGPREGSIYAGLREEISSGLQGAQLVEQVESRAVQLQTAAEVSRAAISTLELSALLQQVVGLVQERFDLYYVGLFLVSSEPDGDRSDSWSAWAVLRAASGEGGAQMLEQGHRLAVGSESMIGQCIADHQPRIASDVGEEAVRFDNPLLPETHSEMALPLITREGAIGALSVQSTERAAFGEVEIAVFETLAGQLANAIANARVYEQVAQAYTEIQVLNERLKDENLRMGAELAVTQRLQQMLLPTEEELRQIEELDIAGFMEPAEEVGGDYYDVLNHNGQIKIGIGDVTGHGLESGVVMLMLQTAVRTLMTSDEQDPVRFLSILNRLLQENTQRMQVNKSMTLALLDYQLGQMRVSGQHEQVIVGRKGGQVELKDTLNLGIPLGLVTGMAEFVHKTSISLQPGDGIVLYSDGITEAENEAEEFYGLERLCQVVGEHWEGTAEEVRDSVIADVKAFIGEQKVYDDITLVVVKQK